MRSPTASWIRTHAHDSSLGAPNGYTAPSVEWIDDVKQWKAGDPAAADRLREYVTPFVHGALLARLPHHIANALMAETLDSLFRSPQSVTKDAGFVQLAVQFARKVAQARKAGTRQERPTADGTVAEGRQWLERLREAAPEELRELVIWRLVEGVPGPELVEVLSLNEGAMRPALERAIGETMVPAQSLSHVDYLWDLSGEPSTHLARTETYAMALRFDPLATPEAADVANTGGTFQDLNDAKVSDVRPEANPFGDTMPTRVTTDAKAKLIPAGEFTDEKTEGAFDLPAAARELQAKTEVATPVVKPPPRPAMPVARAAKSEPKVAPVLDDERPSRRRAIDPPRGSDVGRRETREAPIETTPMTPLTSTELDDERPSRSKLQVKGRLDQALRKRADPLGPEEPSAKRREAGEESARRRNPELGEESARRRNPELGEESGRRRNPESRRSEPRNLEPVTGASQPSIETVPEGNPKQPAITERYTPEPVNPLVRISVVALVAFSLLLAIAWRLGLF